MPLPRHQRFSRFSLTTPCTLCPFRKDTQPGWLGAKRVAVIVESLKDGYMFPCHKTVTHDDDSDTPQRLAKHRRLSSDNKFCAGALHLIEKEKIENFNCEIGQLSGEYSPANLRSAELIVDSTPELIEIHRNNRDN